MINNRQIKADKTYYNVLQSLVETYTEIASARAQKIRRTVLLNREFLQEISAIYEQVRYNYHIDLDRLKADTKSSKKNGKVALVLLTTNSGLYGDLNKKVYDYFSNWIGRYQKNTDVFLIGQRGELLFKSQFPDKPTKSLDFPDDRFDKGLFDQAVKELINYSEVLVFYGQFFSLTNQDPTMNNLTGTPGEVPKGKESIKYLFEPSLDAILNFFENEIFTSLFLQTIYESQLAKYAARMANLDRSTERIKQKVKILTAASLAGKHQRQNRNQQEIIASQFLWNNNE